MRRIVFIFLFLPWVAAAQLNQQPDAARIRQKLKKLNVLVTVLYVAAHPDDENTQVIALMSNGVLATTGYLSMTRGDGGQNLIGSEIRDELGVIRTQELLAARRIDGGRQFFTRANDFGFSKSADETFRIWSKDTILHDVVKVFRNFQPDVVITRFPPDERAGHGHHTASAILAAAAFDASADKNSYPEQLKALSPWQVTRVYHNTSPWWDTKINESTPGIVTLDVGGYNPLLGTAYSEIAARSTSQHKSQGFGRAGKRGYQPEYLEYVKGQTATKDIFEGVNSTWSRVKNSARVQQLVDKAIREFADDNPSASIAILLQIRKEISNLEDGIWKRRKLEETEQLIQECAGLYVGVTADRYWASPGQPLQLSVEVVNRSSIPMTLEHMQGINIAVDTTLHAAVVSNKSLTFDTRHAITSTTYSDAYWLQQPHTLGRFTVNDANLIGRAENDPALQMKFDFSVQGERVSITRPVLYSWTDPAKGELQRPFAVVPPVFVNLTEKVMVFKGANAQNVTVRLQASGSSRVNGKLNMKVPDGWRITPASVEIALSDANQEDTRQFTLTPPAGEATSTATLHAEVTIDGSQYDKSLQLITYDHIPTQILLPSASVRLVKIGLQKEGNTVAYIRGAGDETASALRSMGYDVWEMKNEEVTAANLKRVDAVVMGVRALNINERLPFMINTLLDYVKNGGTMVVQYNTSGRGESQPLKFSPYPLTLSRSRVTEEDSEVRILKADHPLLNYPNKITAKDFDGWAQERGLYFPDQWDAAFEPLLSMNDKGEKPLDGSLLVSKYGQGYYIYTGLSFFRQFPEGVPGAYRLFANLVSAGKQSKSPSVRSKPSDK